MRKLSKLLCLLSVVGILSLIMPITVYATDTGDDLTDEQTYEDDPGSSDNASDESDLNVDNIFTVNVTNDNGTINGALRILLILTAIALAPTLLLMLTGYVRILIVLHFTRTALNTQTVPPNQVLIGLALFLTFYIMSPIFVQIYNTAIVPLDNGEIKAEEAFETAEKRRIEEDNRIAAEKAEEAARAAAAKAKQQAEEAARRAEEAMAAARKAEEEAKAALAKAEEEARKAQELALEKAKFESLEAAE